MLDSIPGLRESLIADTEMCSIAMIIAKETLDGNCGSISNVISNVITRVTRAKEGKKP
jgi:hypothetical protein